LIRVTIRSSLAKNKNARKKPPTAPAIQLRVFEASNALDPSALLGACGCARS
jgi:hypothetical protein